MTIEAPILAFGFGNLAMLGWLAVAAAPLLIHLWSKRRYRQVPWAAMQFLLAAMKRNARRMQLQQWLLLAVRTLIIVLVVIAIAEPHGAGTLAADRTAPTHRILVIDSSFSMAYRDGDESLLARAKRFAAELVDGGGSGDRFTVIEMSASPSVVVGSGEVDRGTAVNAVESIPQTEAGADLQRAVSLAAEEIEKSKSSNPSIDRHVVYFFTDLQRVTWQQESPKAIRPGREQSGSNARSQSSERLSMLAEQGEIIVMDTAPPQRANRAVTRLSMTEPFVTRGAAVKFDVTLHEFGDAAQRDCAVELVVDDVPVGEQVVDVPAGGDTHIGIAHRFNSSGLHRICVRTSDDALLVDNTRWFVADVKDDVRVLCVEGRPGAARYVARALDPDPTDDSPIRPTVVSEGDLAETELREFACVFLCNVGQFATNESLRLTQFAEQGGGVVFFLGDQVLASRYNLLAKGDRALLPARIGDLVSGRQFRLDPLEYRHPIVAPFRGQELAGLLTTPVARYFRVEPVLDNEKSEIALALASGDPLIVTQRVGRGRSIVVATDGSLLSVDATTGEPWTVWPTWPSFLPVVRELLNYAVGGQPMEHQQLVGMPITGRLNQGSAANAVHVIRPDGRTDSVTPVSSPAGLEWSYDDTDMSGIYMIDIDPSGDAPTHEFYALNIDPRESDLSKASADDLPGGIVVQEGWQGDDPQATGSFVSRAAWHGKLLGTAFGLMLLESLIAWYFGRGAA